jgi:hypothetical protein
LPHDLDAEVREAVCKLPPLEVHKLINLIHVLRQIDCIDQKSSTTPKLSKDATDYLVERLAVLQTNHYPPEFLRKKSAGLLDGVYWLWNGIESHFWITDLSTERKQHLIALAYFLQGKFTTDEERAYMKELLLSYWEEMSNFRGLPRFTK